MEYIGGIIDNTINSFDFGLVISINIATYIIIKLIDEINGIKKVNVWIKRLVMIIVSLVLSLTYHFINPEEDKLIINSIILAPVFWSWIGKPIANKFKIDYKNSNNNNCGGD